MAIKATFEGQTWPRASVHLLDDEVSVADTFADNNGNFTLSGEVAFTAGNGIQASNNLVVEAMEPKASTMLVVTVEMGGLVLTIREEDTTELEGEYRDPEGQFSIRRRVVEVADIIRGYRVLFDRHTDGSRWSCGFEYADPFLPSPFIAGLEEDDEAPQSVIVRTTTPHGFEPGHMFQLRGTAGAGELVNTNFMIGAVINDRSFTFDSGRPTFTPWTRNGWLAPGDLPAHTVTIVDGDDTYRVDLGTHYYGARWRQQSEPLPVRRTFRDLVDARLLPNFDSAAIAQWAKPYKKYSYTPMRLAGTKPYQPPTGGRGEIGFVTRWQADMQVDPTMVDTVIAQAESHGTYPWCWRDPSTQAPFNCLEYPTATSFNNTPNVMYVGFPQSKYDAGSLAVDAGHSPALCYVPWLLTGDPWYLEALQFQSMCWYLKQPHTSRQNRFGRYAAWQCRDTAMAALATPDDVPPWILPKPVMLEQLRQFLDNWSAYFHNSDDPTIAALHLQTNYGSKHQAVGQPGGTYDGIWMEDYIAITACWIAEHRPEWREHAEWIIYCCLQRLNGTSGWPRGAAPALYAANVTAGCLLTYPGTQGQTSGNVVNAADVPPFTVHVDQTTGFAFYGAGPLRFWFRKVEWMEGIVASDTTLRITARALDGTKAVNHNNAGVVTGEFVTDYAACAELNKIVQPQKMQPHPDDPTGVALLNANGLNIDFVSQPIGALGQAANIGIEGAREAWAWINEQGLLNAKTNWYPNPNLYVVPR